MRLIDADRTKESIPETSVDIFENCARCGLLDREQVFDLIDEAPTIEPKRGKWETEVRTIRGHKIPFFACSVCGRNADDEYTYCPNCGARMERSEE